LARIDVTVRGAGVLGLACAWEMARRGACVRVIDPAGVAAGASGGVVGALAPHVPEGWDDAKRFQFESLLAATGFWAEVGAVSGLPTGHARTGRLQPIADAAALARAEARAVSAAALWQDHALWRVIPAALAGAWAPVSPTGFLVQDTLSARIDPPRACAALAAAIRARGGEVVADAPEAGPVLHATGIAGLAALSADLGRPVGDPVKGQAALLALDRRHAPQIAAPGLHVVPHASGLTAVGSTSEPGATGTLPDARLDDVIARARATCPALAEAPVVARWAGLRPRARSRAPMLGPWPGRPGHFVANGGFKIGFGIAPGAAALLADLILEGRDAIPAALRVEASL
jgi:glycine/D-amino acid oxidase-like deaminating enzyme